MGQAKPDNLSQVNGLGIGDHRQGVTPISAVCENIINDKFRQKSSPEISLKRELPKLFSRVFPLQTKSGS